MIKNDLQYQLTKKQADLFAQAVAEVLANSDLDPLSRTVWSEALSSQLIELRLQVADYEVRQLSEKPMKNTLTDSGK